MISTISMFPCVHSTNKSSAMSENEPKKEATSTTSSKAQNFEQTFIQTGKLFLNMETTNWKQKYTAEYN